jgi:hypothetical protein
MLKALDTAVGSVVEKLQVYESIGLMSTSAVADTAIKNFADKK